MDLSGRFFRALKIKRPPVRKPASEVSFYPVQRLPRVGSWLSANLEQLTSLRPDLVVMTESQAQFQEDRLKALGLRTLVVPSQSLQDAFDAMRAIGRAVSKEREGEETAASLGVNARSCERRVYAAASLIVGVTAAVGGTIGFAGLIVPHAVHLVLGEDERILVPCSFVAGSGFLIAADTVARTALGAGELPVGVITALAGGPVFLWLLRRHQRYSAISGG